jgi:outer membrane receptor for ferric coprogen and ferric-rhodotorulic acid
MNPSFRSLPWFLRRVRLAHALAAVLSLGGAAEKAGSIPVEKSGGADPRRLAVVELSPFLVNESKDDSFAAANAGTATRLTLNMAEVPAAYSVVTRELIDALNITNAAEAASWAPNGAAASPQDLVQAPLLANNRGIGVSGQQRNNYLTGGLLESYAIEQYEFGRGPNAALFNVGSSSALSGGMGAQTKRARYDRTFDTIAATYGSWDYKRTTLDVNRPLTDKLAMRGNAVWFDRGGWAMNEYERTKGVTLALSYLLAPKTELRLEGAVDSTRR